MDTDKSMGKLEAIHNSSFEDKLQKLLIVDIKELAKRKSNFIKTDCPACFCKKSELSYNLFELSYLRCLKCNTVYLNPCPDENIILWFLENSKALRIWREEMPQKTKNYRKVTLYKERTDYIIKQLKKNKVKFNEAIDIGGGNGELAIELASRNLFKRIVILEPQPLNINIPGVEVIHKQIEKHNSTSRYDAVFAFEVLEHLFNPSRFLSKIKKLLNENGLFIFSTPNVNGYETIILKDKTLTLWFDHIRLYNTYSIKKLLEKNGFEVLEIITPGELDIEIIDKNYRNGIISLDENAALKFILDNGKVYKQKFQNYLQKNNLSSHMKVVARKSCK